jgi:hypothetical protein
VKVCWLASEEELRSLPVTKIRQIARGFRTSYGMPEPEGTKNEEAKRKEKEKKSCPSMESNHVPPYSFRGERILLSGALTVELNGPR